MTDKRDDMIHGRNLGLFVLIILGMISISMALYALDRSVQPASKSDLPPTPVPTPTRPTHQDINAVYRSIFDAMEELNFDLNHTLFLDLDIKDNGASLNMTVSDDWIELPTSLKDSLVNNLGGFFARLATQHHLLGDDPGPSAYPTTYFVDRFGTELAVKSATSTKVVR